MTKFALLSTSLGAMLALLLAEQAQAQTKTFVSSTGGSNTECSRITPCATFANAIAALGSGVWGEVQCLDSGPFTSVTITRTVTIDCAGTVGMAQLSGTITIDAPSHLVTIRNLSFTGLTSGSPVAVGIHFLNGSSLIVEHSVFTEYFAGGVSAPPAAIKFRPTTSAQLLVSDTLININGCCTVGGGILVNPQAGGSALVSLDRVTISNSSFPIVADGTGSTAGIAMTIANSHVHRSGNGILAVTPAGGAPIGMMVKNTRSISNSTGIRATGAGVTVRVDGSTVMNNGTGLVVNLGASLLTFGNNNVQANGTDGTFSGSVPLN